MIGNSYAVKLIPAIYTSLKGDFAVLENFMFSGCEPLFHPYQDAKGCCADLIHFMFSKVKKMKPDVLFIISRYFSDFSQKPYEGAFDSLVIEANKRLSELKPHVATIIISGAMPKWDYEIGNEVNRRLKMDLSFHDLVFSSSYNLIPG
ncbi:hypothetical protein L596_010716 [Steinernema carpocapsae]|uniref:SGNH domain-containing protein n=1 Tax=Steinernema carpocapsae TaxID=34508 RepID=A0A4U5PJC8_STECR|nr:hypothetical protein L596_010716 [Steinernema carpocapsae]